MRMAKTVGLLALVLLVSGCAAGGQRGYGYSDGYYGGGYGGYPGGYRSYGRYPGYYGRGYGGGYRPYGYGGYRQRGPSASSGPVGRSPSMQGGRPPLVGSDGRINPGGYR